MQDITIRTCAAAVGMMLIASLSGCGGGGSATGPGPGPGSGAPAGDTGQTHSYTFGAITARAVSNSPLTPVTAGGGTSTGPGTLVTGLAGASISSLVLSTTSHSLAQTRIAFTSSRNEGGADYHHIYTANPDGSGILQVTSGSVYDYFPRWSADGSTIFFESTRAGHSHIYSVPASGGGVTQLTSGNFDDYKPAASPDGTRIAFNDISRDGSPYSHIYTMSAAGGTPTAITSGSFDDYYPQWSPDSSELVFENEGRNGSTYFHLYTVPSTGGTPTVITLGNYSDFDPAWSPVADKILFYTSMRDGTTYNHIYAAETSNQFSPVVLTSDTSGDSYPSWAPDGSRFVYTQGPTNLSQLWTANADGSFPTRILADSVIDYNQPSWGPFLGSQVLVGTGGTFGATAAGALFGQQSDLVTSVLAFNATTPSTAVINSTTGVASGLPNVIFNITADNLTSLAYVNSNLPTVNTVIVSGGLTATGAIVAFNTVTGAVSSVIPTTAAGRAAVRPTREGNILVYRGSFPGVWDETGKNRAPGGATEVRLDGTTGKLISFR